jgi:hypothetical protein
VYKNWLGGIIQGLLFQKGIYNTQPLRDFLVREISQTIKRKLTFGATNVDTMDFYQCNESLSQDDLIQCLMAGYAVPTLFPYQEFKGQTFFDGSIAFTINAFDAVNRCLEITSDQSEITVDIIFTSTKFIDPWPESPNMKPFDSYIRYTKLAQV